MKFLNLALFISLTALVSCKDDAIDLSGEWQALEFSRVCIDPTDDRATEFTDGCVLTEFNNTFCYTMTLEESSGTYFRTENEESLDDLFISYSTDETAMTIQMTVDGVARSGTFTENTMVFTGNQDGCEIVERWKRK